MSEHELNEIMTKCDPENSDKINFDNFHENMLEAVGFGSGPQKANKGKRSKF